MDRTHAQGRTSAFHPAVVWLGLVAGASLIAGCASDSQLSWRTGPGPRPGCACQSATDSQSKPGSDGSNAPASPSPHTVPEAFRAWLDCLHAPLSQKGPALNAGLKRGNVGLSRYPPAEGERGSQTGPAGNNGGGQGGVGRSAYPPAAGTRTPPSAKADSPAGAAPTTDGNMKPPDTGLSGHPPTDGERTVSFEEDDPEAGGGLTPDDNGGRGDIGLSRYPPAEGERTAPSGGAPAFTEETVPWYSAHEQATVVTMVHNVFPSPYIGPNSLRPSEPAATSMTGTLFLAARLCESARNDTQLIFNPEIAGGTGFSHVTGIAGFPNGEITRVGVPQPTPYIARLYLRQTFGLGGEREMAEDSINQVANERDVHRLVVSIGKLAAPDFVDDNRYAKDPRTQFLNWGLVYNGAWDYPANVRGYTYGAGLNYISKNWTLTYAVFAEPALANGAEFDPHILKAQGQVAELEEHYELGGLPGAARLMGFLNHAHMGNYDEAVELMPVDPVIEKTRSYRYKYGFGISINQALSEDIGFLSRIGWNDGHTESWAYTEIDRTLSAGLVMGGRLWCRPYDRVGVAGILNGISGPHRRYLEAGGLGFIIGDGRLAYAPEEIFEFYYAMQLRKGIVATIDFQEVGNPAYNSDRGPVSIVGLRVHFEH